mmetsp:Transcript_57180/g.112883  ORF Transcript_57180/g.112883 Transcript_57180/m.112883 type:complete len:289 (-) Transcript_57180:188-1054(-)
MVFLLLLLLLLDCGCRRALIRVDRAVLHGFWGNKVHFIIRARHGRCFDEAQEGYVNLVLGFLGAVNLAVGADVIRGDHVRVSLTLLPADRLDLAFHFLQLSWLLELALFFTFLLVSENELQVLLHQLKVHLIFLLCWLLPGLDFQQQSFFRCLLLNSSWGFELQRPIFLVEVGDLEHLIVDVELLTRVVPRHLHVRAQVDLRRDDATRHVLVLPRVELGRGEPAHVCALCNGREPLPRPSYTQMRDQDLRMARPGAQQADRRCETQRSTRTRHPHQRRIDTSCGVGSW